MTERKQGVLDKYRNAPCEICRRPSDPAHIKSWGSGGQDEEDNLISLCRQHHTQQHQVGWVKFCSLHPKVAWVLAKKGWVVAEVFGVQKLTKKEHQ